MIQYNPKGWFRQVYRFHKSDTIIILWKELIIIGLLTWGISWIEIKYFSESEVLDNLGVIYSLIGFVLSLLLVFRTNTAYDRWWEGRKKWGSLVNDSRNLALKINSMVDLKADLEFFGRMIPNYAFAMKEHLREGVLVEELQLTEQEKIDISKVDHKPSYVAMKMYDRLDDLKKRKEITQEEFLSIDKNLLSFSDIIGACERIKKTPIPFSYSMFLKKFIFIYVVTLPIAFIISLGYYTIPIAMFVFYVLVSIEILAEEIEDPFGKDANDLDTDGISTTIRSNVQEILIK
ncbi:MAG: bestrophin family ion channel [Flavobacteriales bacterium]|nr:bestrophin family ion channel [Flavobacteriales bacterium]